MFIIIIIIIIIIHSYLRITHVYSGQICPFIAGNGHMPSNGHTNSQVMAMYGDILASEIKQHFSGFFGVYECA